MSINLEDRLKKARPQKKMPINDPIAQLRDRIQKQPFTNKEIAQVLGPLTDVPGTTKTTTKVKAPEPQLVVQHRPDAPNTTKTRPDGMYEGQTVGPREYRFTDNEWLPYIATGAAAIAAMAAIAYFGLPQEITSMLSLDGFTKELLQEAGPLVTEDTYAQQLLEAAKTTKEWLVAPVMNALETNPQTVLNVFKESAETVLPDIYPQYAIDAVAMAGDFPQQVLIDASASSGGEIVNSLWEWAQTQGITSALPTVSKALIDVAKDNAKAAIEVGKAVGKTVVENAPTIGGFDLAAQEMAKLGIFPSGAGKKQLDKQLGMM